MGKKIALPLTSPVSYFHITVGKDQLPVNISGTALLDSEDWTSTRISLCSHPQMERLGAIYVKGHKVSVA